jgi:hypothetical protein
MPGPFATASPGASTPVRFGYDDAGRQTSATGTVGTTTLSSFTYSYQRTAPTPPCASR